MKWYRKAAEQGNVEALPFLGKCYFIGEGIPKDIIEAYAYFSISSITNYKSKQTINEIAQIMTPDQLASAQKRTKELQAELSKKGN